MREDPRQMIGELLAVGDGRYVRTIMAMGHPTEQARAARWPPGEARRPLDEPVRFD